MDYEYHPMFSVSQFALEVLDWGEGWFRKRHCPTEHTMLALLHHSVKANFVLFSYLSLYINGF